jgi:hypothetical protein
MAARPAIAARARLGSSCGRLVALVVVLACGGPVGFPFVTLALCLLGAQPQPVDLVKRSSEELAQVRRLALPVDDTLRLDMPRCQPAQVWSRRRLAVECLWRLDV